jgi:hypothetical protein
MKTFQQFCEDAYLQLDEQNLLDRAKGYVTSGLSDIRKNPVRSISRGVVKPFVKDLALDLTGVPEKVKKAGENNPIVNTAVDVATTGLSYAPWRKIARQATNPQNLTRASNTALRVARGGLDAGKTILSLGSALAGAGREF